MSVDNIKIKSDMVCPRCNSKNIRTLVISEDIWEIECLDCNYFNED